MDSHFLLILCRSQHIISIWVDRDMIIYVAVKTGNQIPNPNIASSLIPKIFLNNFIKI